MPGLFALNPDVNKDFVWVTDKSNAGHMIYLPGLIDLYTGKMNSIPISHALQVNITSNSNLVF